MFDLIKQLIGYSGQANIDNSIITICQIIIPLSFLYIIWGTTKIISFVANIGKQ